MAVHAPRIGHVLPTTGTEPLPGTRSQGRDATLLAGGAGILLYRTIALARGARTVLRPWVIALTYLEMLLDIATLAGALRWWRSRSPRHAHLPLRTGAAAALLHAGRVLVFVLGRTGPWVDFDVRPEARADHDRRWTWTQVVVAAVLSVLGVIGTAVIWRWRSRHPEDGRQASPPAAKIRSSCTYIV